MEVKDPEKCAFEDCPRPKKAAGLCAAHYQRKHRGAPMDAPMRQSKSTLEGKSVQMPPVTVTALDAMEIDAWVQEHEASRYKAVQTAVEEFASRHRASKT